MKTWRPVILMALVSLGACSKSDRASTQTQPTPGGLGAMGVFKIKQLIEKEASWTDENIAKDPVSYLTWSLGEFDELERRFEGDKLGVRRQLLERQAKSALETQTLARKEPLLATLKEAYRKATVWPVRVEGAPLDQRQLEQLITETYSSVVQLRSRQATHEVAVKKLQASLVAIDKSLVDLRQSRVKLLEKLDDVKLQRDIADLDNLRSSVSTVLNTALAVDTDRATNLNSDDVLALQQGNPGQSPGFAEIMRE